MGDLKTFLALFLLCLSAVLFLLQSVKLAHKNELIILSVFLIILFHSLMFIGRTLEPLYAALKALIYFMFVFIAVRIVPAIKYEKILSVFLVLCAMFVVLSSDFYLVAGGKTTAGFHGVFNNPNQLALFISVFLLPYMLCIYNESASVNKRLFYCLMIANLVLILYFTKSRGALLTFFVSFLFFYSHYYKLSSATFLKLFVAIFLLMVVMLSTDIYLDLVSFIFKSSDTETSVFATRLPLWALRLEGISDSPLLGSGYQVNNYVVFDEHNVFPSLEKGNTILAIIEEFGIFIGGFLIFIICNLVFKLKSMNGIPFYFFLIALSALIELNFETWLFIMYGKFALLFWFVLLLGFRFQIEQKLVD